MFIKNKTKSYQSFTVGGKDRRNILLAPEGDERDTVLLSDELRDDPVLQLLFGKGVLEELKPEKGEERQKEVAAAKAEREERKEEIKVVSVNDTKENDIRLVKCAAIKANGQHCAHNVHVPFYKYDSDKPYFCGRHKKEDASDYEKIDGEWVKKVKPEPEREEPVAEEAAIEE